MVTPRLLGVDKPATPGFQQRNSVRQRDTQIGDQAQQIALDAINQTQQYFGESNRNNAAIMRGIADNMASATMSVAAETNANAASSSNDGIGSLFGVLGQGISVFLEAENARRERELEKARGEALVEATRRVSDLRAKADIRITEEPTGFVGYISAGEQILREYEGLLSPEDMASLTRSYYGPAEEIMGRQAAARASAQEELRQNRSAVEQSQVLLQLSQLGANIRHAVDPNERLASINQYQGALGALIANMAPADQLLTLRQAYEELRTYTDENSQEWSQLTTSLERMMAGVVELEGVQNEFRQTGNLGQYNADSLYIQQLYGLPSSFGNFDPQQNQRYAAEAVRLRNTITEAQFAQSELAIRGMQISQQHTGVLAYVMASDPGARARLETQFGRDNPVFNQALAVADLYSDYQVASTDRRRQIETIQQQQQRLAIMNEQDLASWITADSSIAVLEQIGLAEEFTQSFASEISQYLGLSQNQDRLTPEQEAQLDEARQNIFAYRQDLVDSMSRQADVLLQEESQQLRQLSLYGLDNPANLPSPEDMSGIIQQYEAEVNSLRNPSVLTGGSPNFELPRLQELDGSLAPIPPDAGGFTTGLHGEWRGNRQHAGHDIGVVANTPITFYDFGEVVNVEEHPGTGYGRFVDIRTPDGYIHRFAHLNAQEVRIGQQVNPGQVIGLSGDTGSPGSYHLHWEVRSPQAPQYGFEGTVNPLEHMQQYRNGSIHARTAEGGTAPFGVPSLGGDRFLTGYVQDNRGEQVLYSPGNPYQQSFAPKDRSAYVTNVNDPASNFGYRHLQQNRDFRIRMHEVAADLNVPTQWLADLIAFETGGTFSPSVPNYGGYGAYGLIQFTTETLGNMGYSVPEVTSMSDVEQLDLVQDYLSEFRGRLHTPYHLLMAVWGGSSYLNMLINEGVDAVRNISDGDITFADYTTRLGEHAGRVYEPLYPDLVTVTNRYTGSPQSQNFQAAGSAFSNAADSLERLVELGSTFTGSQWFEEYYR